jgi:hypothetical protein
MGVSEKGRVKGVQTTSEIVPFFACLNESNRGNLTPNFSNKSQRLEAKKMASKATKINAIFRQSS